MTKIVDVRVELVQEPVAPCFRWRDGLPGSPPPAGVSGRLVVVTDDGVEGVATIRQGVIAADVVERRIAAELLGHDPLAREWLWHRMWEIDRIEELPLYLLGLADVALWDIAAKLADLPLYRLLGAFRDSIPAYASTATYGDVAEYLDVADQCLELGYRAIKLHAWGDVHRDVELCTRLRDHVGAGVELMYDGSAGFDLPDAVRLGRALSELDYLWYEEPMREFSVTAYRRLAEAVDVPLMVAETSDGAHMNTADFIAAGAAQFVRTSARLRGGITGAMRTAHLADAFRLRAEVHGGGPVNAHLCMAISNTTMYEAFVHGNPVIPDPLVRPDGTVAAPTAPGAGT
ncbi:enolase C-terminal domain-like protein [Jiangella asiatica]|uniref:Racemase n=1 Tax=Jiangella asiatica TaxID=2530372 RepID=A0A4R5DBT7_9ACTN|nr:enolase C-terminal domain-like protein [Jiangella asiatica]TDE11149.1 racemase [Jiangella asiatica]